MYGAKLITQLPDGVVDSSMLVVIGDHGTWVLYKTSVNSLSTQNIISDTWANVKMSADSGGLIPGYIYHINDQGDGQYDQDPINYRLGLWFTAITNDCLSTSGARVMLCPSTYLSGADTHGNIWNGVWDPNATTAYANYLYIWGGKVWKNLTGSNGSYVDDITLDNNWELVDKSSYSNFEYKALVFDIEYDIQNNWITKQSDMYGNVFGIDFTTGTPIVMLGTK